MYIPVKGGERAILKAYEFLAAKRPGVLSDSELPRSRIESSVSFFLKALEIISFDDLRFSEDCLIARAACSGIKGTFVPHAL